MIRVICEKLPSVVTIPRSVSAKQCSSAGPSSPHIYSRRDTPREVVLCSLVDRSSSSVRRHRDRSYEVALQTSSQVWRARHLACVQEQRSVRHTFENFSRQGWSPIFNELLLPPPTLHIRFPLPLAVYFLSHMSCMYPWSSV
jgi:hypothetical protein